MPSDIMTGLKSLMHKDPSSPEEASARRDAERERRIARARAEAVVPAATVAAAAADRGNGGPPELTPLAEIAALGELLYGDRWTTDVGRVLGHGDGRTVRRWKAGDAEVSSADLAHLRRLARSRAQAILRLVGDGLDEAPRPRRDPAEIRAAFESTIAASRADAAVSA